MANTSRLHEICDMLLEEDYAAMAPLSNITEIKKTKHGFAVTIGVDRFWGERMCFDMDDVSGGLILARTDRLEYRLKEPDGPGKESL